MRNWLARFMIGRYGMDQLSKVLNWISLIFLIISMIVKHDIFLWIAIAILLYSYYRIFSRNTAKRYQENIKFLDFVGKIKQKRNRSRYQQEQRKIYKFFVCPQCKQKVRVPKGKGKICITCPKCRMEFVRRS